MNWPRGMMTSTRKPSKRRTEYGLLPMLAAADAACDRLTWFLSDSDTRALEQCADVMRAQKVSLRAIRRWLAKESWPEAAKRSALDLLASKISR